MNPDLKSVNRLYWLEKLRLYFIPVFRDCRFGCQQIKVITGFVLVFLDMSVFIHYTSHFSHLIVLPEKGDLKTSLTYKVFK